MEQAVAGGGKRDAESGDGSRGTNHDERRARGDAGLHADERAGGAAEGGRRKDEGERGPHAEGVAGDVVAELVGEQDCEEREGEGQTTSDAVGIVPDPGEGKEVGEARQGRIAELEVVHVAGANRSCGEQRGHQQHDLQPGATGRGSSGPGQLVNVRVLEDVCRGHCPSRTLSSGILWGPR
jgi:hypothetical protein